jgi:adiponectin receptor
MLHHLKYIRHQMTLALRLRVPSSQPPEVHNGPRMRFIEDTASKADGVKLPVLLSLNEMPKWFQLQSNRYILHGYRTTSGSAYDSYSSWSYIHNESLNIYSHLIPAILFLSGAFYIQRYLVDRYREVAVADIIVFSIFMLAAVISLSLSATYHTLMNHSEHLNHLCLRLDMLGVVVFILGDLVLGIYLVFWCEPCLRNIYWSMVSRSLRLDLHLILKLSSNILFSRSIGGHFRNIYHFPHYAS